MSMNKLSLLCDQAGRRVPHEKPSSHGRALHLPFMNQVSENEPLARKATYRYCISGSDRVKEDVRFLEKHAEH